MKQKLIKTPLRYPGGKSRMAETLVSLMPSYTEYREPFLGGGSVFLTAKQVNPDKSYWVNDLYYDLYCFWEAARDNMDGLIDDVVKMRNLAIDPESGFNGKDLYWACCDGLSSFEEVGGLYVFPRYNSVLSKAVTFFILNRITFSGTSLSGGYSQESFDKRFTPSSIERLKKIEPLLQGAKMTNLDYSEVLSAPGDDVFIFLDPPYYTATKSALYGKNGELHKGFDHERFAEELKKCPHRWMMTYDNCDYIKETYKDFNIIPFEFAYGMRNATKNADMVGKELLITNYETF